MRDWSDGPSETSGEDAGGPSPARRSLRTLRLLLAALVLVAGLAVASPHRRLPEPAAAAPAQCAAPAPDLHVIVLPPGHPPIPGLAPGRALPVLPPGHPPIDLPPGRPVQPAPASPTFQPPATVDL